MGIRLLWWKRGWVEEAGGELPKATLVSAVALWAVLVVAPGLATSSQGDSSAPFVTIAAGRTSRIPQPAQLVIRDRETWLALWRRHAGPAAAPPMDFDRQMVIAVFAGTSTTLRAVTIARIVREPERLMVWYSVRETPLADMEGLPPGAAFHIVRLARSLLPVAFSQIKTFPVVPRP